MQAVTSRQFLHQLAQNAHKHAISKGKFYFIWEGDIATSQTPPQMSRGHPCPPRIVHPTLLDLVTPLVTGSAVALHCCKAHSKSIGKMENLTPCKIVTPENFILKLGTRDYV